MFYPAGRVIAARIVVGPVYDATAIIRFVLATKLNNVSTRKSIYPRCEINVMRYEYCLAAGEFKNKSLMPAPFVVVRQDFFDRALGLDHLASIERTEVHRRRTRLDKVLYGRRVLLAVDKIIYGDDNQSDDSRVWFSFHRFVRYAYSNVGAQLKLTALIQVRPIVRGLRRVRFDKSRLAR